MINPRKTTFGFSMSRFRKSPTMAIPIPSSTTTVYARFESDCSRLEAAISQETITVPGW